MDDREANEINDLLFEQLASLAADSLVEIRKRGLLKPEFLGVLPNKDDDVGERYECIRNSIIEAMKTKHLTPTFQKTSVVSDRTLLGLPQGLGGLCATSNVAAGPSSAEAVEPLAQGQGRTQQTQFVELLAAGAKSQARGLSVSLNSTAVDQSFRQFDGHMQVNATDFRKLPSPSAAELRRLGVNLRDLPVHNASKQSG